MTKKGWMERHYMKGMDFVPVQGYLSRKERLGLDDQEKVWRSGYNTRNLSHGTDVLRAYNILLFGLPVIGGLIHLLGD